MLAGGAVAGRPPNMLHAAPRATAPKRLGLVTLWDGSANHECALPLWCQQAHRLARKIPPPWRTELVRDARGLPSLNLTLPLTLPLTSTAWWPGGDGAQVVR